LIGFAPDVSGPFQARNCRESAVKNLRNAFALALRDLVRKNYRVRFRGTESHVAMKKTTKTPGLVVKSSVKSGLANSNHTWVLIVR
jgi:hypothetical protein